MFQYFEPLKKSGLERVVRRRAGERKLGELIEVPDDKPVRSFLENTQALFVVLGIAEDIGVLANGGNEGTATAWQSFLESFLNIQANDFTNAKNFVVIGRFSFDEVNEKIVRGGGSSDERLEKYRKAVPIIDDAVAELIQWIVTCKKIPIVIGGGHNNAYPIIKGTALGLMALGHPRGINCVNLDAHVDYRVAEGRHSGNAFRYAKQDGFLLKYFPLGIHENYIPNPILQEVKDTADIAFSTYEEIFIYQRRTWMQALRDAAEFVGDGTLTGIELDLDSIEYLPASAATPCGVSSREALQYVVQMSSDCQVAYLHVCEGIASDNHGLVGKLISYIVASFAKSSYNKTLD